MSVPRPLRRVVGAVVLAVAGVAALATCATDLDGLGIVPNRASTTAAHPQSAGGVGPHADITVFADGVVAGPSDLSLTALHTGSRVADGWYMQTDATGFAAADLGDGSVVRLGPDTRARLGGLAWGGITMTMDSGRSWHHMNSFSAGAAHTVAMPAGQIGDASPDATFAVDCEVTTRCVITVFDGSITVSPTRGQPVQMGAFQRFVLYDRDEPADTDAAPSTLPVDVMLQDRWTQENLALDTLEVRHPRVDVSAPPILAAATLAGKWGIDTVVVTSQNPLTPPGTKTHRDWEFKPATCNDVCSMTLERTFGDTGRAASQTVREKLIYLEDGFKAYREFVDDCVSPTGEVIAADAFEKTSMYDLRVTEIEVREGIPVATRLEGTAESTVRLAEGAEGSGCQVVSDAPDRYRVTGELVTAAPLPNVQPAPNPQPTPTEASGPREPGSLAEPGTGAAAGLAFGQDHAAAAAMGGQAAD